tara:strand:- start:1656 stop:2171 length:516 start_codon:yes stop_codon:yes gene_type:complete
MIHLNIGSNLKSRFGGKFANIEKTLNLISKENISIEKISSFYKTPSYPNRSNPYFVNLGINIRTKIQPIDLLKKLKNIERIIGRINTFKNAPRVCDIDIIDYNGMKIDNKKINLPHKSMHLRNFVLFPLKELNYNWYHPVYNKKIDFFLKRLDFKSHIEITRLNKSVIKIM